MGMKRILEEFANGNLNPNERYFNRGSAFSQAGLALQNAETALRSTLDEAALPLLDRFQAAEEEMDYLVRTDRFLYGYRLGLLMGMEALGISDELLVGGGN